MQVHSSSLNLFNSGSRKDGSNHKSQSRGGGGGMLLSKSSYNFGATDSTSSLALFDQDWSKESLDKFFSPVETFLEGQLRREKSSKRRCGEIVRLRNIKNYNNMVKNKLRDFDEKINLNLLLKKNAVKKAPPPPPQLSNSLASESQNFRMLIAQDLAKKSMCCDRCNEKNKKYEEKSMNAFSSLFESILAMNTNNESTDGLIKLEDIQQQQHQPAPSSHTRLAPVTRLLDKRNKLTGSINTSSSSYLASTSSIKSDLTKLPKLADSRLSRGSRHIDPSTTSHHELQLGFEHTSQYGHFESRTFNELGVDSFTKKTNNNNNYNQVGLRSSGLVEESVISMASSIDESILSDRSDTVDKTHPLASRSTNVFPNYATPAARRGANNNVISRSLLKQRANLK